MDAAAPPGAKDRQGVHTNTADCDCAHCSGDLWLSAVVSPAAPGVAVCPEHADVSKGLHVPGGVGVSALPTLAGR